MKIRLINKEAMSPLLVDKREGSARRVSGLLEMTVEQGSWTEVVYGFRHLEDKVWYQLRTVSTQTLVWVAHEESMSYQPYAPVVVSALSQLPTHWDGVMYRYADKAYQYIATRKRVMTVMGSYLSHSHDLWFLVNLSAEAEPWGHSNCDVHPIIGWIAAAELSSPLVLPEVLHFEEGNRIAAESDASQAFG